MHVDWSALIALRHGGHTSIASSKVTSPGWPDPTSWLAELTAKTNERGRDYLAAVALRNADPDSYMEDGYPAKTASTIHAAGVLMAVASALDQLPTFKDSPGAIALDDLVTALLELPRGETPFLLTRGELKNSFSKLGRVTVQIYAVLCVRLLAFSKHYTDSAARDYVAKVWAGHGHRGQKGSPLSAATLQNWGRNIDELPTGSEARDVYDKHLQHALANPSWPPSIEQLQRYVRLTAANPRLANKYGSPPRNHMPG